MSYYDMMGYSELSDKKKKAYIDVLNDMKEDRETRNYSKNEPELIRGLAALDWGNENITGPDKYTDITISNKKLKKNSNISYTDYDTDVWF